MNPCMRENAVRVEVRRPRMRGQIPCGICEVHRLFVILPKQKGHLGVPAIKQIETYKLKRRKGTGNFSFPVLFWV